MSYNKGSMCLLAWGLMLVLTYGTLSEAQTGDLGTTADTQEESCSCRELSAKLKQLEAFVERLHDQDIQLSTEIAKMYQQLAEFDPTGVNVVSPSHVQNDESADIEQATMKVGQLEKALQGQATMIRKIQIVQKDEERKGRHVRKRIKQLIQNDTVIDQRIRRHAAEVYTLDHRMQTLEGQVTQIENEVITMNSFQQPITKPGFIGDNSIGQENTVDTHGPQMELYHAAFEEWEEIKDEEDVFTELPKEDIEEEVEELFEEPPTAPTQPPSYKLPKDCADAYHQGLSDSGLYEIHPQGSNHSFHVYCDQEDEGGGWTLFQRRGDGSESFYRGWRAYKEGFGHLEGEHWLGNDKISAVTKQGQYLMRVTLEDWSNSTRYAEYSQFYVENEDKMYRVRVGSYYGNAGDSFPNSGSRFSTYDSDYDASMYHCAELRKAGWWYWDCTHANLNGIYYHGGDYEGGWNGHYYVYDGITWLSWKGYFYSLKSVTLKVRPEDFGDRF
ncbi:ANGPTL1 [Branchiostoma lanceolatum]|uniref:ANGPTL1 protein n=1 Tax=Branchiostoma lanceolatum TaxID=7740 RepID=A0A8J9ZFC5_BRALA|nr:ANGPTL1 [Branchiostoma lanceolatum]